MWRARPLAERFLPKLGRELSHGLFFGLSANSSAGKCAGRCAGATRCPPCPAIPLLQKDCNGVYHGTRIDAGPRSMTPDNAQIALASETPANMLIDPFGRRVDYLRVSVTDRCDFRCVYCMAEEMTFLPKAELLSLEAGGEIFGL